MEKSEARMLALKNRRSMNKNDIEAFSNSIAYTLKNLVEYKRANYIMSYCSFDNEVETKQINKNILTKHKNMCIPYIKFDNIIPLNITTLDGMEKNKYNINEAKYNEDVVANIYNIDFIIVPLVAFDKKLNRVGFGKGYYDRFFNSLKKLNVNPLKVGLAFESLCIEETIDSAEFDVPLDIIVTEKQIYHKN